ncbi:MAG: histidine kinase dimerization/phosphoacceptor domain -containing protein [Desulfobacteraceae bacterium]
MAHGFTPTTKGALVTRVSNHIVYELDGRPAKEVCSEILGVPSEDLGEGSVWFSQYPFGGSDIYGNYILQVPECVLDDGSIQFGPLMKKDQVVTLMRASEKDIVEAGLSAFEKALRHGGLKRPSLALVFSCALRKRLMGTNENREIGLIHERAQMPIGGFYTYGEQGASDDGLPVYGNQSVSTLVFSDELNPVAALIHKSKRVYQSFSSRLERKAFQIKGINRVNQLIQEEKELGALLEILTDELSKLLSWAEAAFYLPLSGGNTYEVARASNLGAFPKHLLEDELEEQFISNWLDSHGERFGVMVLKPRDESASPDEGDLELAEAIGKLTAGALHKIKVDGRLDVKIKQLDMLNQLGHELAKSIGPSDQAKNIIRNIRRILELSGVSLWVVDQTHQLLVKEATDAEPGLTTDNRFNENDERLTKWQVKHCEPVFSNHADRAGCPLDLIFPFPYEFASLPIYYMGFLRGILNLYATRQTMWSFQDNRFLENIEFLKTISNQVGVFIENRFLHKNATLYKEIHHRVKNNLQNIASLLRMQMRRLDRITPERALEDSISRIMSMAAVHDILSHGEPGMVELGLLISRIGKVSLPAHKGGPIITLDNSGPSVTIPSKMGTTVALVINELIQNAIQHGIGEQAKGAVAIRVSQISGFLTIVVHDNGPGLPKDFDVERDGNLGLTIVRTLVKEELRGLFLMHQEDGTQAEIVFPISKNHIDI